MRSQLAVSDMAPYIVSKSGVTALTRAMGIELAPYGINVNAIAPGRTLTEGAVPFFSDMDRRKRLEKLVPIGRLVEPEEIADVALFLASEKAKYIAGAVIPVDGGYTIYKE
jgi:Dehydrogenases with different specificities (related to short-chain alcohol dehydrogenases)